MTQIVEHKSLRYTWELVRHTYLVDLESEIEVRQVGLSPPAGNRLLDPPYPFTPFFEIEIDQIQKNGKTVFSLRNICPVRIDGKPDRGVLNSLRTGGSPRIIQRYQSQEGENETRWLYTDDFFLISASSGDRHDLSMLLSLIINKLNMIALSIQSGRRIRSEFENQQKFRAAMNTMFSDGVDGAFREVPVYLQHGDMTGRDIDVSAALVSEEFQDLTAFCASEGGSGVPITVVKSTPAGSVADGNTPADSSLSGRPDEEPAPCESIPEINPPEGIPAGSIPSAPPSGMFCGSCGGPISRTTKFCGSCGTAVSTTPVTENARRENAPALSGLPDNAEPENTACGSRPEVKLVIDVKTVEELQDLSWLSE